MVSEMIKEIKQDLFDMDKTKISYDEYTIIKRQVADLRNTLDDVMGMLKEKMFSGAASSRSTHGKAKGVNDEVL